MTPRQTAYAGAVGLLALLCLVIALWALSGCVLTPPGATTPSQPVTRTGACDVIVPAVCSRRGACGTQDVMECRREWLWRCPVAPAQTVAGDWEDVRSCRNAVLEAACLAGHKPIECEALTGLDWRM